MIEESFPQHWYVGLGSRILHPQFPKEDGGVYGVAHNHVVMCRHGHVCMKKHSQVGGFYVTQVADAVSCCPEVVTAVDGREEQVWHRKSLQVIQ